MLSTRELRDVRRTLLLCLLCLSVFQNGQGLTFQSCQMVDACSCRVDDDGGLIDLHWAGGSQDGQPVFQTRDSDPDPARRYVISYSPCAAFSCGAAAAARATESSRTAPSSLSFPLSSYSSSSSSSSLAALCLQRDSEVGGTNLGTLSTVRFRVVNSSVTLVYDVSVAVTTAGGTAISSDYTTFTSRVFLQCRPSGPDAFVLVSNSSSEFDFALRSPCACPGACRQHQPGSMMPLSPGTTLILIFLAALVLYFGLGSGYNRLVQGGNCVEVLPHRAFWCSLPSLVRDGYLFFISPCLGNRAEYRAYDKL